MISSEDPGTFMFCDDQLRIVIIIYEMLTRGVLTIEMLQGIFSWNAIIYIIFVGVIIFLRKYLFPTPTPEKTQIAKLEKSILALNNELSDHKWAGIWCSISTGNKIICRILEVWRSIVHLAIKKSKHFNIEKVLLWGMLFYIVCVGGRYIISQKFYRYGRDNLFRKSSVEKAENLIVSSYSNRNKLAIEISERSKK